MLSAAVSGSFHRHMDAITAAVHDLAALGVRVLSPADPRIVAQQGEFLFVASDRVRSVRLVQDRHLESIRAANFLWLVCPDGYVGQSASMELGYAAAAGIPIFATHAPADLTLREYVKIVPNLITALSVVRVLSRPRRMEGILIDPHASVEKAHCTLDRIAVALTPARGFGQTPEIVHQEIRSLQAQLALPSHLQ
jgi:hypothetical protein